MRYRVLKHSWRHRVDPSGDFAGEPQALSVGHVPTRADCEEQHVGETLHGHLQGKGHFFCFPVYNN